MNPLRLLPLAACLLLPDASAASYDLLIRNGLIFDGSGAAPYRGEVAVQGERIAYVGKRRAHRAKVVIDAKGQAISPGFINMLAHPEEALFADGRALSDIKQGITLEVMGEGSMGPLNEDMAMRMRGGQGEIKYEISWRTLDGYLRTLEQRGVAPNIASLVGAGEVRTHVLGETNVQPGAEQLARMRALVAGAMEDGALGVSTALIYNPNTYASTAELTALASEAGRCGGIYSAHMRSEGDRIEQALLETIAIARASGAPAHIYHLKLAGRDNWHKLGGVIAAIEKARAEGLHITADMYTYTAGATGLDAAMPPWVQEGGAAAWHARLRQPEVRSRLVKEMRDAHPATWENLYGGAGPEGTLLLGFKNPALRHLTGKTLAEVARNSGVSPEDAAIDLVLQDGSRVDVAYFLMSEDNLRRQVALPWLAFGSDAAGQAPEGVFLQSNPHPRSYGNVARLFARYVRDEQRLTVQEAVRKLSSLAADILRLPERGRLKRGAYADIVVFDPAAMQDHATFAKPHQLASGVQHVLVNGRFALRDGQASGAPTGRVVRGRGWREAPGGGCKGAARDWRW